jgi:serine/threonine-protein kinase
VSETLAPGKRLAERFRLVEPVGQGGIGQVWLAKDRAHDNAPVACKILRPELAEDRAALSDLKREVLLTRRLRHPGIVGVYTFWEAAPWRFVTMEYVDGGNLSDFLTEREQPFTTDDVLPWLKTLSEALDYAHEEGILHRDVKPANMMRRKDGKVRLGDFGIARTAQEFQTRITGHMTQGTLLFMSPEQLMGEPLDSRSDLYSLASSVYELLNGTPPFHSGSVITQIQMKPAPPIDGVPDAVNDVLLKALEKEPDSRYATCGAFHTAFATAVSLVAPTRGRRKAVAAEPHAITRVLASADTQSTRMRLGRLLVESSVISNEHLTEALKEHSSTGEPLGAVLVKLGFTTDTVIAQTVAEQLALPFKKSVVRQEQPDVAALVSKEFAEKHLCLPLRRYKGRLEVAMANPLDIGALNTVEAAANGRAEIVVTTEGAVHAAVKKAFQATRAATR